MGWVSLFVKVSLAYKKALRTFHPDSARKGSSAQHIIDAEERFKILQAKCGKR